MTRFDSDALEIVKTAVFQEKPFLVITVPGRDEMKLTFRGDEDLLVLAIKNAMEHDKDFNRIINRALKKKQDSEYLKKNRTLQLTLEIN
jgi:hypothetical protein